MSAETANEYVGRHRLHESRSDGHQVWLGCVSCAARLGVEVMA